MILCRLTMRMAFMEALKNEKVKAKNEKPQLKTKN